MSESQGSLFEDQPSYARLLIRASAGTGKTFQLTNRFLRLLRDGVPCDQILAVTFTRKAAGEILDRVIQRLAEAVDNKKSRDELADHTEAGPLGRDDCLRLLQSTMRHLHRLRIGTLDSYYAQIARGLSLELGMPPTWQIIDELQDARIRSEAIEAVLSSDDTSTLRTLLNLLSKGEARRHVSQLVRDTVNSLYTTFLDTTEPAWHTVPRLKELSEDELAQTLEDLRTTALPNSRQDKTRHQDYDQAVTGNWQNLISKGLGAKIAAGEDTYYKQPIPDAAIGIYTRLIEHIKASLVGRVAMQTEATYELLKRFHDVYRPLKQSRRRVRFEDVTFCLADHREAENLKRLEFRLDSRIDHLLLDEFQDTSAAQWRVLTPLADRVTKESASSFFCVGDVKQAIYSWRGGVAEIFDAIESQLDGLQAQTLNDSYRSSQPVIDTVNRVFTNIADHPRLGRAKRGIDRWCKQFSTHRTKRADLPGFVELRTCPLANKDAGEVPKDVRLAHAADLVRRLNLETPDREIGVLVRSNDSLRRLIYELRQRGINASEEGGNPLTDSAAVMLVVSLLRLTDHPGDTVARFHLLHSPLGREVGLSAATSNQRVREIAACYRRQLMERGYGQVINEWVRALLPHCDRRERSRLQQLLELAYTYEPEATLRPSDFVEYIETTRVSDPLAAKVRVMTIHQSKGLEFDVVVLPDLDGRLISTPDFVSHRPQVASRVDRVCRYAASEIQELMPRPLQQMFAEKTASQVGEAMCVLYVAMTRAIHSLHMLVEPHTGKSFGSAASELLRFSLAPNTEVAGDTVLYQHGDPNWYQKMPEESPMGTTAVEVPTEPLSVHLASTSGTRTRGWDRTSPSALEGDVFVNVHQMFEKSNSIAMHRGTLIHAWFEQIEWLDGGQPEERLLRDVASKVITDEDASELDVDRSLKEFQKMLQHDEIGGALCRRRYADLTGLDLPTAIRSENNLTAIVQNERGFAIRDGNQLLNGFIDRLVLLEKDGRVAAAEIIDYKTDRFDASDADAISEKVQYYAPQLQAYRRAVARLTHVDLDHIAATLLFVSAGCARRVDH